MEPILSLVKNHRRWRLDDLVRDFFAAMRWQAMEKKRAWLRLGHQFSVHLVGEKCVLDRKSVV